MMRATSLFGISAAFLTVAIASAADLPDVPPADADRLERSIEGLSAYGANADGGVDRVAYSQADIASRKYVMGLMQNLGLETRVDAGGNIFGHRAGEDESLPPILFGSHTDTVPGGGNYDGPAGVLTALEVIELLNTVGITTHRPLEVVVFSNEEGGLIGSLILTGNLQPTTLDLVSHSGLTIREGIRAIGGDPDNLEAARIHPGDITAFVELHIEQGAVLDQSDADIGVVEGIVGIRWWDVTILGTANHAGTTPMDRREDALVAGARLVLAVNEAATAREGSQVATVGRIAAFPGAPNVVPGRVEMSLEIRDLDDEVMDAVFADVEAAATEIAANTGTVITFAPVDVASHPAPTDERMRRIIAEAAAGLGLSYRLMPSGAGHDAQDLVPIAPTGMIFLPSVGGVSHSPREFTHAQDLANGADVLARSILAIDGGALAQSPHAN